MLRNSLIYLVVLISSTASAGEDLVSESKLAVNPIPEWDAKFNTALNTELMAQGVNLEQLKEERDGILSEPDSNVQMGKARGFYDKYKPYYEQAMVNLNLSQEAIQAALLQNDNALNPADFLSIINPNTYTCTNPFVIGLCNLYNNSRCTLETIRPGGFNIFPAFESTKRYSISGNSSGNLAMQKHNIDGRLSRNIGAHFNADGSARICVQTSGRLDSFFASSYRDHYFFTRAYSTAELQLVVKNGEPIDAFGARTGRLVDQLPNPALPRSLIAGGTHYELIRNEGGDPFDIEYSAPYSHVFYLDRWPQIPYHVEDMVWIYTSGPAQQLSASYTGSIAQYYRGASVDGRIDFTLQQINILRVPN